MTFGLFESSRDQGGPICLYFFRYGEATDAYYAYTDAEQDVTVDHGGAEGAITYEAVAIRRGSITSSGTLDKATLDVTTDRSVALADMFRVYPPSQVVTLILRENHLDDPDQEFPVTWTGRVVASSRGKGSTVTYACEPVSTSMRRPGLRRHYQYGCPHALYGPQCGANKAAATVMATVSAIDRTNITLTTGWNAKPVDKYLGGMIEWTNDDGETEIRTIMRVSGDTLSLNGLLRGLTVSETINVILGCSRQMGDCVDIHNNIVNYGGQPWIPLKNPIGFYNNYY